MDPRPAVSKNTLMAGRFFCCAVSVVVAVCVGATVQAAEPETEWAESIARCRAIAAAVPRLDCYDALAAPEPKKEPMPPPEPTASARDPLPAAGEPDFGLAEETRTLPPRLTAVVASVRRNRARRQVIELTNGQLWRQSGSARLRLKPGDSIEIEPGALGSFLLRKPSGGGSMRIQRIQ